MNSKEFFKPTTVKIVLFIIFLLISFFLFSRFFAMDGGPSPQGFPFTFMQFSGCAGISETNCWDTEIFSYPNLIIDIIFWYLISCLIFSIFRKSKT